MTTVMHWHWRLWRWVAWNTPQTAAMLAEMLASGYTPERCRKCSRCNYVQIRFRETP